MNISTKLQDETFDPEKPDHGYEWWYFDALGANKKWGIVVIFYQGNPFSPNYIKGKYNYSPEEYPAISVSVYRKGKPEFYSFIEYGKEKFEWGEDPVSCKVGSNFFKRTEEDGSLVYELLLNHELKSGHNINGRLKLVGPIPTDDLISMESENEKHFWNLIQPKTKVVGSVNITGRTDKYHIAFHGDGYHDHNTGHEPMKDSFRDWYWGRFHFEETTLVYYVMNKLNGDQQYHAWLIDTKTNQVTDEFTDISLSEEAKNIFGLETFRKINLKSDSTEVTIHQSKKVDNGPFYMRYISQAILKGDEKVYAAEGFTEYIRPDMIYEDKYWWMVKMRLRFKSEKPHWVQKSTLLYPLTW